MTMLNPPVFPQALLGVLVRADARDAVCGDLLEEYRDARVPALGRFRAGLWYWRQVLGIWFRAYWWLVVPVILLMVASDIFNTFRAPSGASYLDSLPTFAHLPSPTQAMSNGAVSVFDSLRILFFLASRLPLSPFGVFGFFAIAGVYGSWRTQQFAGGQIAALGMFVTLWLFMLIWWNATFYPFANVQQSNPYWIQAWQWSTHRPHAPRLSFVDWLYWDNVGASFYGGIAMLFASIVCGGVGSALGMLALRRSAVTQNS